MEGRVEDRDVRAGSDGKLDGLWNRTAHRAAALAASLREKGVEAVATEHLDAAVSNADLVSCATMSEMPLLKGECLKPGAHVDLVGSFTPAMREADDEALRRARVFVDSYGILDRSGDFVGLLDRGVITGTTLSPISSNYAAVIGPAQLTVRDHTL